ncbi:unnamed protein product [Lymnaea stagnalis]|uniref:Uncharacterized protein n=1 Tax=Lymnaea stagnalis TaxID=6523 RepID=A0AAV2IE23_LYMST
MDKVDLTYLVRKYFEAQLDEGIRKRVDRKNPLIDWSAMSKTYGPTVYLKSKDTPKPKLNVLFSANFENTTQKPQVYTLRTDRRTKAITDITFNKSFSFDGQLHGSLRTPDEKYQAFKVEYSRDSGNRVYDEQELKWGVDSEITVTPGHCVRAELVVKETEYSGEFEEVVTFDGDVSISYLHKKDNLIVETFQDKVAKIFITKHGFKADKAGRPTFTITGVCKRKVGVEQFVNLIERKESCQTLSSNLKQGTTAR